MAKYRIGAGVEFESLTEKELKGALDTFAASFMSEFRRGKTYKNFSGYADIAGSAVTIGAPDSPYEGIMGPDDGFTWSVRRLTVVGLANNDIAKIYRNTVQSANAVEAVSATTASPWPFFGFSSRQFILKGNEKVVMAGSGLAATGRVYVIGLAEEVPTSLDGVL